MLGRGEEVTLLEEGAPEPKGCVKKLIGEDIVVYVQMAGLIDPSEGRLTLDGAEILGPGRERGMVFQSYTSFPWLSVRDNVEYDAPKQCTGGRTKKACGLFYREN